MWSQFFLENLHFAINLVAALVMFGISWLYLDAWTGRKTTKELFKIIGFLLLSFSFLISATYIETTLVSSPFLGKEANFFLTSLTRLPGLLLIIISLLSDPLQKKPGKSIPFQAGLAAILPALLFPLLYPILMVAVGFLYLRRATIGLENHLKKVALGFFILSFAELFSLSRLLENTDNIDLYRLVSPFGPIWILQHLVLLAAMVILLRWVFGYLLKRLFSQLFFIFTTTILLIFLLTSVTFTFLLVKNMQDETLRQLETDVKVLNFAIESKKSEAVSDAQVLAQNPQLPEVMADVAKKTLKDLAESFLLTKKQSVLAIVNEYGQVLARGEDRERTGDALSDDPLIRRALLGQDVAAAVPTEGVLAPEISIRAAVPVRKEETIIGAVATGTTIDNAFVDGLKTATGLEASIYGGNKLSATTLTTADGRTRPLGILEENRRIKTEVLGEGKNYIGGINILNQPYFAVFLPLKDIDGVPLGMLFVGKPQITVLQTAGRSIELTFLVTVVLLVLSVLPVFALAKYLTNQLT